MENEEEKLKNKNEDRFINGAKNVTEFPAEGVSNGVGKVKRINAGKIVNRTMVFGAAAGIAFSAAGFVYFGNKLNIKIEHKNAVTIENFNQEKLNYEALRSALLENEVPVPELAEFISIADTNRPQEPELQKELSVPELGVIYGILGGMGGAFITGLLAMGVVINYDKIRNIALSYKKYTQCKEEEYADLQTDDPTDPTKLSDLDIEAMR